MTPSERQRLQQRHNDLQAEWEKRTEKLSRLRNALVKTANAVMQYELEEQIQEEEEKRNHLESQLSRIEEVLNRDSTPPMESQLPKIKEVLNRDSTSQSFFQSSDEPTARFQESSRKKSRSHSVSPSLVPEPEQLMMMVQRIWFLMLPIVLCWLSIGRLSRPDQDYISMFVRYGAIGGVLSGFFWGYARWRVLSSIPLEQILLIMMVSAILGGFSWLLICRVFFAYVSEFGALIGLVFGSIIAIFLLWHLSVQRRIQH